MTQVAPGRKMTQVAWGRKMTHVVDVFFDDFGILLWMWAVLGQELGRRRTQTPNDMRKASQGSEMVPFGMPLRAGGIIFQVFFAFAFRSFFFKACLAV